MLLRKPTRPRVRRDERGAALVAVVILMALCSSVVMAVAAGSMFGIRETEDDQSRLQALAAAEAGRDYTLSQVAEACQGSFASPAGAPAFSTEVLWAEGASTPPASLPAAGCPVGATAGLLGIRSTGTAEDGATKKTVIAWYPRTVTTYTIGGTAGVIMQPSGDSPVSLKQMNATGPVVYDMTGPNGISCNSMHIAGDLIFWRPPADPNLSEVSLTGCQESENGPSVSGDVYAYGDITIGAGTVVDGDVVSVHGTVTVKNSGTVLGSTWSKTAHPGEEYSPLPAAFSLSSLWLDFLRADVPLSDTTTYDVRTPSGTSCNAAALTGTALTATKDAIVDATGCASGLAASGTHLTLAHDLTVLLPSGATSNFQSVSVASADGQHHDFNLVVPDTAKDEEPTPAGCNAKLETDDFTMASLISGLAYTPCVLDIGGTSTWQGQLFAATINGESGSPTVTYVPMTDVPGAPTSSGFGGESPVDKAEIEPTLVAQSEPGVTQ